MPIEDKNKLRLLTVFRRTNDVDWRFYLNHQHLPKKCIGPTDLRIVYWAKSCRPFCAVGNVMWHQFNETLFF